jgi:hypothetical protein
MRRRVVLYPELQRRSKLSLAGGRGGIVICNRRKHNLKSKARKHCLNTLSILMCRHVAVVNGKPWYIHSLTWQYLISKGYPCGHALAVLLGQQKPIKEYVKSYFTVEYYGNSYAGAILHPCTIDFAAPLEFNHRCSRSQSGLSDSELDEPPDSTLPPSTRRPPGRPPKRRIRTKMETSDAAPVKLQRCGRCKKLTNHNKRTCKEPIP